MEKSAVFLGGYSIRKGMDCVGSQFICMVTSRFQIAIIDIDCASPYEIGAVLGAG